MRHEHEEYSEVIDIYILRIGAFGILRPCRVHLEGGHISLPALHLLYGEDVKYGEWFAQHAHHIIVGVKHTGPLQVAGIRVFGSFDQRIIHCI